MQGKDAFIQELLQRIDAMIASIEDRETMDDDLSITRELAEQLREEVLSLEE